MAATRRLRTGSQEPAGDEGAQGATPGAGVSQSVVHTVYLPWVPVAVPYTLLKFLTVGAIGYLINQSILFLLYDSFAGFLLPSKDTSLNVGLVTIPDFRLLISSIVAVEIAIVCQFTLHERWTFRERPRWGAMPLRLLKFNTTSAMSPLIIVATVNTLTPLLGISPYISNTIGVLLGTSWNWTWNTLFIWPSRRGPDGPSGTSLRDGRWASLVRWIRQLGIVVVIYAAYSAVRAISGDEVARAMANAADMLTWERNLGLDWELQFQSWSSHSELVVHAANLVYLWCHLPALALFAVWMIVRGAPGFPYLRNVWVLSEVIGLLFFVSYPVAPPRLMPAEYGFVDTLAQHSPVSYTTPGAGILMNKYAAFPSLHFAWSFIIAVGLYKTMPWRAARWAAFLFPILSFWSILATANHFVIDVVAGAVLIAFCFAAVTVGERPLNAWRRRPPDGSGSIRRRGTEEDWRLTPPVERS